MASGDNDKKGFSGFDDLVSDVTKELETPDQRPSPKLANTPVQPASSTQQSSHQPDSNPQPARTQIPQNTSSGKSGSGVAWFWGIAIIFVTFTLFNKAPSPTPADTPSTEQPYNEMVAEVATPAAIVEDVSNPEEIAPVGNGLVLSRNQIRYCLSEEVRLLSIKGAIDSYSQYEVDNLNSIVDDYNSRCSNFRYRSGLLESVKSEVSLNNSALVAEGSRKLSNWRAQTTIEAPAAEAAPAEVPY